MKDQVFMEKCNALNFYAANQVIEMVLEDYQCYPEHFLGKTPKNWFNEKNPNPLYDLPEFSVEEIKEIAAKISAIDNNCPIELELNFEYALQDRYQKLVRPMMLRKIEAWKQQLNKELKQALPKSIEQGGSCPHCLSDSKIF